MLISVFSFFQACNEHWLDSETLVRLMKPAAAWERFKQTNQPLINHSKLAATIQCQKWVKVCSVWDWAGQCMWAVLSFLISWLIRTMPSLYMSGAWDQRSQKHYSDNRKETSWISFIVRCKTYLPFCLPLSSIKGPLLILHIKFSLLATRSTTTLWKHLNNVLNVKLFKDRQ